MRSNTFALVLVVIVCLVAMNHGAAPQPTPHHSRSLVTTVVHWVSRLVYLSTFREPPRFDNLVEHVSGPEDEKEPIRAAGVDGQVVLNHAEGW